MWTNQTNKDLWRQLPLFMYVQCKMYSVQLTVYTPFLMWWFHPSLGNKVLNINKRILTVPWYNVFLRKTICNWNRNYLDLSSQNPHRNIFFQYISCSVSNPKQMAKKYTKINNKKIFGKRSIHSTNIYRLNSNSGCRFHNIN